MSEQELELPKGWESTSLAHILETLEAGKRPKGGVKKSTKGIPSLGGEHLTPQGNFNFQKLKFIPLEFFNSMEKGQIKLEDVLIVKDGATTGKVSFVRKGFPYSKSAVNEHVFILRANSSTMLQLFLFYYLFSLQGQKLIKKKSSGLIGGINTSFVNEFDIPICPLNEQKRIVSKIEELFSKIDSTKQSLEHAKLQLEQYRQSLLKFAFEGRLTEKWREKNKNEISPIILENKIDKAQELPSSWSLYNLGNLIKPSKEKFEPTKGKNKIFIGLEHIERDTSRIIGQENSKNTKSTKTVFRNGDVLYGKLRPYLNKVTIPDFDGVCSTDILVFQKNPNIVNRFLMYFLIQISFVRFANRNMSGVQHPRISFDKISEYTIQLPSILEQEQIVSQIKHGFSLIENTQNIVNSTLQTLEIMRMSVLKKAFEGRLVPQDPNDEPAEILLEYIKKEKARLAQVKPNKRRKKNGK